MFFWDQEAQDRFSLHFNYRRICQEITDQVTAEHKSKAFRKPMAHSEKLFVVFLSPLPFQHHRKRFSYLRSRLSIKKSVSFLCRSSRKEIDVYKWKASELWIAAIKLMHLFSTFFFFHFHSQKVLLLGHKKRTSSDFDSVDCCAKYRYVHINSTMTRLGCWRCRKSPRNPWSSCFRKLSFGDDTTTDQSCQTGLQ